MKPSFLNSFFTFITQIVKKSKIGLLTALHEPILEPTVSVQVPLLSMGEQEIQIPEILTLYKKSCIGEQVLVHRSENSILDNLEGLIAFEARGRKRYATCSGVSWFAPDLLATVNVYGQKLRIYKFDESNETGERKFDLKLLHEREGDIYFPDDVAVSPDQNLIAVTHSLVEEKGVSILKMVKSGHEAGNVIGRLQLDYCCHGVTFSPESRFLAFTLLEGPGTVEVYDVMSIPFKQVCVLATINSDLKPKDICFTTDGKYVAIVYADILRSKFVAKTLVGRRIGIHRFDSILGKIEEKSLIDMYKVSFLLDTFELGAFQPGFDPENYRLFVTNQVHDRIVEFTFNAAKCSLEITGSHRSGLSFPHGLDVSPDGSMLAVTNFGDDCLRIYKLDSAATSNVKDTKVHVLVCGHSATRFLFGAERSLIDLVKALSSLGYKVSCLLPHENIEYTDELSKYAAAIYHLPFEWNSHARPYNEVHVGLIKDLIHKESIDIIHSNSMVIPDVLLAARKASIISILHARELLLEDFEIAHLLGGNGDQIVRQLAHDADYIIANSRATQHQFKADVASFRLYNTIDVQRFDLPMISETGTLKVVMISNNSFRKGLKDFIQLAQSASFESSLEFFLIGPKNSDFDSLGFDPETTIQNLQIIDYIKDPKEALALIDVVVNLSSIAESFGRTIVEGMAARRPVVAYEKGAMSELITTGETGFLIAQGDIRQVLAKLLWLSKNRGAARAMGEAGRYFVKTTFSFEVYQENLKHIYEQIIQNKSV